MYSRANTSALLIRPWAGSTLRVPARYSRHGIGQTQQQLTQVASGGASALIGTLVATGAIAGPVGALIGAGVGLVAMLVTTLFAPNYNKIAASNDVNSIEPYLKQNLANWLSLPSSQKFASVQAAAVATAQGWIAKMEQLCQSVPGSAGQNCISQRAPGGCGFHVAAPYGWINGQFVPSGANDPTGPVCWDWGYYVNSISQDPNVVPDNFSDVPATAQAVIGGTPTAASSGPSAVIASTGAMSEIPWWVWGLGGLALVWAVAA
jgi:hypothetical protein